MAIKLPQGSHEDAPQEDLSFLDLMTKPGALDPPQTSRTDAGARIDHLMAALNTAVTDYRRAVEAEHGAANAADRVSLAVKNSARRAGPELAKALGLR